MPFCYYRQTLSNMFALLWNPSGWLPKLIFVFCQVMISFLLSINTGILSMQRIQWYLNNRSFFIFAYSAFISLNSSAGSIPDTSKFVGNMIISFELIMRTLIRHLHAKTQAQITSVVLYWSAVPYFFTPASAWSG